MNFQWIQLYSVSFFFSLLNLFVSFQTLISPLFCSIHVDDGGYTSSVMFSSCWVPKIERHRMVFKARSVCRFEYNGARYLTRTCIDGGMNDVFQEKFMFTLLEGLKDLKDSIAEGSFSGI
ncbi:PREDICTED: uncharacterized protein LOC104777191 isoform X2 [Camelina sativa]|uniref:Uncharacterized protein LOC104777191 isoform X2 n=1 Tax=Camelina sativa TaxID=90675 RepID=A0ABM1REB6_CAMSA|nr:PREDICTED: uncharacterized protein LOC104777191 isoform X2 [Camelina sativa]